MTRRTLDIGTDDVHVPGSENTMPKTATKKRRRGKKLSMSVTHPDGTKVEVRHMAAGFDANSDCFWLFSELALADHAAGPVWIQMAKRGEFAGHHSGPFRLDEGVFNDIVRNFKASENKVVPIDFEHASELPPSAGNIPSQGAPAQGWVKDLRIQGGNLFALVEWSELARQYIREGKYKFISPAIRFGSKDRVTGQNIGARLTSAGLTNQPFLDGMLPLAAKDTPAEEDLESAINEALEEHELEFHTDEEDTTMADEKLTLALSDATGKVAELSLKLKDAETTVTAKDAEIVQLKAWRAEREAEDVKVAVEVAYETYKDSKKLTDGDKAHMLSFCKASPDAFRGMYPAVKPGQRHLLREVTPKDTVPATRVAQPNASSLPTQRQLADQYRKEGKSNEQACSLAFTEHQRLLLSAK